MIIDNQTAVALGSAAVGVGTSLGIVKANIHALREKVNDSIKKIDSFHGWKGTHDVLANETLINQERRFGDINASVMKLTTQYDEILRRLGSIDDKLERRDGEDRRHK